jgi:homoserine dehydrogenase
VTARISPRDAVTAFIASSHRPGVLAQVAEILGLQGCSVKSVVQKGLGEDARLEMVVHPVLTSNFMAAVELIGRLDFVREPPRVIRVIDEAFDAPGPTP